MYRKFTYVFNRVKSTYVNMCHCSCVFSTYQCSNLHHICHKSFRFKLYAITCVNLHTCMYVKIVCLFPSSRVRVVRFDVSCLGPFSAGTSGHRWAQTVYRELQIPITIAGPELYGANVFFFVSACLLRFSSLFSLLYTMFQGSPKLVCSWN